MINFSEFFSSFEKAKWSADIRWTQRKEFSNFSKKFFNPLKKGFIISIPERKREKEKEEKRERERSILIIFHFENPIGLERKRYLSLSLALSKSRAHVSHHLTSYVKLNELKLSRHFLNNGFKLYKKNILPQQKCSNSRSLSVWSDG